MGASMEGVEVWVCRGEGAQHGSLEVLQAEVSGGGRTVAVEVWVGVGVSVGRRRGVALLDLLHVGGARCQIPWFVEVWVVWVCRWRRE